MRATRLRRATPARRDIFAVNASCSSTFTMSGQSQPKTQSQSKRKTGTSSEVQVDVRADGVRVGGDGKASRTLIIEQGRRSTKLLVVLAGSGTMRSPDAILDKILTEGSEAFGLYLVLCLNFQRLARVVEYR